ncbi:MAG: gp53-like domain-containing protein [Treponema sp.]|uniref:gp53-like domain-containing protein n=1 Tax=Treponema sp. TaxID=166 RepID=UPI003FA213EE
MIQWGDGHTRTWVIFPLRYSLWRKVFCLAINTSNAYGLTQNSSNSELARFNINSCRWDGTYESVAMSWFAIGC